MMRSIDGAHRYVLRGVLRWPLTRLRATWHLILRDVHIACLVAHGCHPLHLLLCFPPFCHMTSFYVHFSPFPAADWCFERQHWQVMPNYSCGYTRGQWNAGMKGSRCTKLAGCFMLSFTGKVEVVYEQSIIHYISFMKYHDCDVIVILHEMSQALSAPVSLLLKWHFMPKLCTLQMVLQERCLEKPYDFNISRWCGDWRKLCRFYHIHLLSRVV